MTCFLLDIKNLYKSRIVKIVMIIMTAIVILDPVFEKILYEVFNYCNGNHENNAYIFWLLNNKSLIAYSIYYCLLTVFPVLFTGLVFFWEYSSSIYPFKITKMDRKKYLLSKFFSVFTVSFVNTFLLLSINLIACFAVFSFHESQETIHQFTDYIPNKGTFAYYFYSINPLLMAVFYNFLNALTIAILSVLALSIQMIFKFKNPFSAFLVPTLILFLINYYSDVSRIPHQLNIFQIVQPTHSYLLNYSYMTADAVAVTYMLYIAFAVGCAVLGIKRNEEYL